jgi:membrane-associated phospholipid phosphatase
LAGAGCKKELDRLDYHGVHAPVILALLVSMSALVAAPCHADDPPADNTAAQATSPAEAPALHEPEQGTEEHRLKWDFPRFRLWQYVAVGVQTAANLTIEFTDFPSRSESWRSTLPLDTEVRNALRPETREGRDRAAVVSDYFWWGTQFYTVVVDSLIVPLAFDDSNTDVALQMTMINWQALGLTGLVTRIAHHTGGRARPVFYGCSEEPGASFPCGEGGPGFFAGHVSMTSAGAALACAHHAALPLYGENAAPGILTCVVLSGGAVTVGVLRIMADRHWISDVVVGHLVGGGVVAQAPPVIRGRSNPKPRACAAALMSRQPLSDF